MSPFSRVVQKPAFFYTGSYAFNHVVASAENRWIFIQNAIDYLRRWKFDGLDLDWEYPGLPERGTTEETRDLFSDFVKVSEVARKGWRKGRKRRQERGMKNLCRQMHRR